MRQRSYFFVGLIVASILTICYLASYGDFDIQGMFPKIYMSDESDFIKQSFRVREYRKRGIKTILRWNTFFGDKNFYFGEGNIFRDCPVDKCEIFNDRDYLNVKDYDAILFHGNELKKHDMPLERKMRQLYVYVNLESPANRPVIDELYEDYFNLTMTYYLDSDIPWTYYIIEDIKSGKIVAPSRNADWSIFLNSTNKVPSRILDIVSGKSKLVTWFVSNCGARSGRLEYVNELSKHISVDIYGECGKFNCYRTQNCFDDIVEPNYFFYLSFENTLCDDYVTEKLMNPLRYNIVPVVYGGVNYSQFAPPNSYVNALDFENPKALAAYLQELSHDLWRYQSYLEWKKYYRVKKGEKHAVCTLCEVLHKQKEPKMYAFLSNWYIKDKCPIQTLLNNISDKYITKATLTNRG